jgi:DNA-binding NtrC family response regulator
VQAKLLRVLEDRKVTRLGGRTPKKLDVRFVAATNRDIEAACKEGQFRPDLYDRLNVLPLSLPPLRARREDIPVLARHFLQLATQANDRPGMSLTEAGLHALTGYSFPGNVRELKNVIERLVILTPDDAIDAGDVKNCLGGTVGPGDTQGLMAATARALGLERSHMYKKCRALGVRGGEKADEDVE